MHYNITSIKRGRKNVQQNLSKRIKLSDDILSLEENRFNVTLSITKREEISNRWIETSQKKSWRFSQRKRF